MLSIKEITCSVGHTPAGFFTVFWLSIQHSFLGLKFLLTFPSASLQFLGLTCLKNNQQLHPWPRFSFKKNHLRDIPSLPQEDTAGWTLKYTGFFFFLIRFLSRVFHRMFSGKHRTRFILSQHRIKSEWPILISYKKMCCRDVTYIIWTPAIYSCMCAC